MRAVRRRRPAGTISDDLARMGRGASLAGDADNDAGDGDRCRGVTWARISDRTVSRAVEKAGRQSEKAAAAAVDRLYERLQSNDFHHVEAKIESVEAKAHADREAMESRIGDRFDRMGGRIERMEKRLLAAVQRRPDTDDSESGP